MCILIKVSKPQRYCGKKSPEFEKQKYRFEILELDDIIS